MTPPTRNVLQRGLLRLAQAAIVIMAFVALGNLAGSEWGPLKKLVHFPAHWAPLALVTALTLAVMKRWKWAAAASVLAVGFGAQVATLWLPPSQDTTVTTAAGAPPPATLTVLSFNVFRGNKRHKEVLDALQKEQADVVYLTEMSPEWFCGLKPLEKDYPHRVTKKNSSDWLLSKHPLENAEILSMTYASARSALADSPGNATLPEEWSSTWHNDDLVVGTVIFHGTRIRLAALHPPIPSNASRVIQQRACAAIYARALNSDPKADAKLLMGDFNTTSFSPTFRSILSRTGLSDTAQGYGYLPTWGPRLPREPILPWLGIPIDHILASENVSILHYETGPPLGSDHLWVKVRMTIGASLAPQSKSKSLSHAELNPAQTYSPTQEAPLLASNPPATDPARSSTLASASQIPAGTLPPRPDHTAVRQSSSTRPDRLEN
ncbi:endonuclease/exonuclease/phosphatase family protein [Roseimicrobium sp. ORNL1]|nr:endonuclease/exonuclease/phosphatase family protein [Roseimicrobium sp. ORNL1]